jgi:hypothetical protein
MKAITPRTKLFLTVVPHGFVEKHKDASEIPEFIALDTR